MILILYTGYLSVHADGKMTAKEYGCDYLFSYYATMQWAAVFHDEEFAAKDIPFDLKILR